MADSRDGSDAMKSFAKCHNIQYAIIRASITHDSPELLVLAYADEKSLRSLIAEPSIIALGFASRSAADAARRFPQKLSQRMHAMSGNKKRKSEIFARIPFRSLPFNTGVDVLEEVQ